MGIHQNISFLCECGAFHSVSIEEETIVGCSRCHAYYDCCVGGSAVKLEPHEVQDKLKAFHIPYLISTGSDVIMESGRPANFFDGNTLFDFSGLDRKNQSILLRSVYAPTAFRDLPADFSKRAMIALDPMKNCAIGEYNMEFLMEHYQNLNRGFMQQKSADGESDNPIYRFALFMDEEIVREYEGLMSKPVRQPDFIHIPAVWKLGEFFMGNDPEPFQVYFEIQQLFNTDRCWTSLYILHLDDNMKRLVGSMLSRKLTGIFSFDFVFDGEEVSIEARVLPISQNTVLSAMIRSEHDGLPIGACLDQNTKEILSF